MFTTRTLAALIAVSALFAGRAPAQNNTQKPDLTPTDITADPSDNEVKVKVKNIGDKRADDTKVRLRIVASVSGQVSQTTALFDQEKGIGSIGSGNDKNKEFDVDFDQIKAKLDQFKAQVNLKVNRLAVPDAVKERVRRQVLASLKVEVTATADSQNQEAEKNEGNNNRTEPFPLN